jgi:hypothetical protein
MKEIHWIVYMQWINYQHPTIKVFLYNYDTSIYWRGCVVETCWIIQKFYSLFPKFGMPKLVSGIMFLEGYYEKLLCESDMLENNTHQEMPFRVFALCRE